MIPATDGRTDERTKTVDIVDFDDVKYYLSRMLGYAIGDCEIIEGCGNLALVRFTPQYARTDERRHSATEVTAVTPLFAGDEKLNVPFRRLIEILQSFQRYNGAISPFDMPDAHEKFESVTASLTELCTDEEISFWVKHMRPAISQPRRRDGLMGAYELPPEPEMSQAQLSAVMAAVFVVTVAVTLIILLIL